MTDYSYDAWPSGYPYDWSPACRGIDPFDDVDFHVDIGCGTLKKGRIGIDRHAAPGVNIVAELDPIRILSLPASPGEDAPDPDQMRSDCLRGNVQPGALPFADSSIESVITHHALEHIGEGFIALIDEVYRVLKPNGLLRAITPLFPSRTAVEDPDHCRYFMAGTWETFCGRPGPGGHWHESFSVPYMKSRFSLVGKACTPASGDVWDPGDTGAREIRVALRAEK